MLTTTYSYILRDTNTCFICDTPCRFALCGEHLEGWREYEKTPWFMFLKASAQKQRRRAKAENWKILSLDALEGRLEDKRHDKGHPTRNDYLKG